MWQDETVRVGGPPSAANAPDWPPAQTPSPDRNGYDVTVKHHCERLGTGKEEEITRLTQADLSATCWPGLGALQTLSQNPLLDGAGRGISCWWQNKSEAQPERVCRETECSVLPDGTVSALKRDTDKLLHKRWWPGPDPTHCS